MSPSRDMLPNDNNGVSQEVHGRLRSSMISRGISTFVKRDKRGIGFAFVNAVFISFGSHSVLTAGRQR